MTPGERMRPHVDPVSLADLLRGLAEVPAGLSQTAIHGLSVDSTDIDRGWAFLALGGERHHGARFATQALSAGAAVVITDQAGADLVGEAPVVVVDDPRAAAGVLSARLYGPTTKGIQLAAVTGTNGKTTTSHMLRTALARRYGPVALMATGMMDVDDHPQYMLRTTAEAPVVQRALAVAAHSGRGAAVVEVSAHAMSLHRLDGLRFDSAVFTNLQHDHLDYYQSMDRYYEAKASLFTEEHVRQAVICVDDEWGQKLAETVSIPVWTLSALSATPERFLGQTNHWQVTSHSTSPERWGISFVLRSPDGRDYDCFSPVPGLVNIQNAAAAILCAVQMEVPIEIAIDAVASTPPIAGRMELIRGLRDSQPNVLVDYAHTPEAFAALLDTVRPLVTGKVVMAFGTDGDRDASKREELGEIAAKKADVLWVTDENPRFEDAQSIRNYLLRGIRRVRPEMTDVTEVTESRRDAVRKAIQAASAGDLVVIPGKGSEAAQEIQGVFHAYSDSIVAQEVLSAPL